MWQHSSVWHGTLASHRKGYRPISGNNRCASYSSDSSTKNRNGFEWSTKISYVEGNVAYILLGSFVLFSGVVLFTTQNRTHRRTGAVVLHLIFGNVLYINYHISLQFTVQMIFWPSPTSWFRQIRWFKTSPISGQSHIQRNDTLSGWIIMS